MKIVITGGAGFIGSNAAARWLERGAKVVIFDNLSRRGSQDNINWLREKGTFELIIGDVRDQAAVEACLCAHRDADLVLHLAAQVAVTTSVVDPRGDFEINAVGTFNVLEAMRKHAVNAQLIYASTNKVYGRMADIKIVEQNGRYMYAECPDGISEHHPLDFHSPYGCSKGAADQYVRDYARIYGLKTVVFRQSCIYGYRQFGIEDQGWVAWFVIACALRKQLTIYGDGNQVRDVLFIDDMLDVYDRAYEKRDEISGQVFNIGGGSENTLSLLELLALLERELGCRISPSFANWRPGDQLCYISDITRARSVLGWQPQITSTDGVKRLYQWVLENRLLFEWMV